METLPERVVWLRDVAALPKRGLSKLAGLDPSHVRLLEESSGQRTSRKTAEALAAVFGVELAWLMLGVGPCIAARPELDPERPEDRDAIAEHIGASVRRAREAQARQVASTHTASDFDGPVADRSAAYDQSAEG